MFAAAWEQRRVQAAEIVRSGQRQIDSVEKQIETLLSRIMDASNPIVIRSYEKKITELERGKVLFADNWSIRRRRRGSLRNS
ncbi:hypothetical protein HFO97_18675 [Rhizobium leguminosarum]|nr:hypothetical protein [Rhizobium leguminosarum]